MICKKCGTENEEDALFCKKCGKQLNEKNICPSCNAENEDDAFFCKKCGTKLQQTEVTERIQEKSPIRKGKALEITRMVFNIISICMCGFGVLFAFGVCFAPFLETNASTNLGSADVSVSLGLFQVIDNLKAYVKPEQVYGSEFHFLGEQFPNIILLIGICLSLIGCTGSLIYTSIKAIKTGISKQFPSLEKGLILSVCSLLVGLLFSSLMFMGVDGKNSYLSLGLSLSYGSLVMAAISIGISWLILNYIIHFVLDIIEGMEKRELIHRIFRIIEFVLLVIIVFNIACSFLTINLNDGESSANITTSIMAFFSMLSAAIYSQTQDVYSSFEFEGNIAASYIFTIIAMVIVIAMIITVLVFFVKRSIKMNENKSTASLATGITMFILSILLVVLVGVSTNIYMQEGGAIDIIFGNYGNYVYTFLVKLMVGPNPIVFVVFSVFLLAAEIVWFVMQKQQSLQVE